MAVKVTPSQWLDLWLRIVLQLSMQPCEVAPPTQVQGDQQELQPDTTSCASHITVYKPLWELLIGLPQLHVARYLPRYIPVTSSSAVALDPAAAAAAHVAVLQGLPASPGCLLAEALARWQFPQNEPLEELLFLCLQTCCLNEPASLVRAEVRQCCFICLLNRCNYLGLTWMRKTCP